LDDFHLFDEKDLPVERCTRLDAEWILGTDREIERRVRIGGIDRSAGRYPPVGVAVEMNVACSNEIGVTDLAGVVRCCDRRGEGELKALVTKR